MGYFVLNTAILADGVNKYKNNKKNYKENLDSTYNMLKNVDSGWYSPQASIFIEKIKSDEVKLNDYFSEIDAIYKSLETLKNSFDDLFAAYGCRRGSTLRFDDDYYWSSIRHLKNTIEYLNRALSYANSCNFKADFTAIYKVYVLRNEIATLKNMINNIINSLTIFRNKTNKILSEARNELKNKKDIKLDIELINYTWSAQQIIDTSTLNNKNKNPNT